LGGGHENIQIITIRTGCEKRARKGGLENNGLVADSEPETEGKWGSAMEHRTQAKGGDSSTHIRNLAGEKKKKDLRCPIK